MVRPRPNRRRTPAEPDDATISPFYIAAGTSARLGAHTLKHGDTFAVLDAFGDAQASGPAAEGLFHEDMRYLSRLVLLFEDQRPLLLSSRVTRDNTVLTIDLANPDIYKNGGLHLARDQLHLLRSKVLDEGACFEQLEIRSFADSPGRLHPALWLRGRFRRHVRGARTAAPGARRALRARGGRGRRHPRLSRPGRSRAPHPSRIRPAAHAAEPLRSPLSIALAGAWRHHHHAGAPLRAGRRGGGRGQRFRGGRRRGERAGAAAARGGRRRRQFQHGFQCVDRAFRIRSPHARDRQGDRPLPLCRHPVVQHRVRPRRAHHGAAMPVDDAAAGARRARIPCGDAGDGARPVARRRARQDPARDPQIGDGGARRGAVRPLLRQRRQHAALRRAGIVLSPAHRRYRLHPRDLAQYRGGAAVDA